MSYSNQSLVQNLLGRALTADEVTLLPYIFAAVDGYIDNETGVTWGSASGTKYFDGSSFPNGYVNLISIPGASAVTSVSYVDSDGVASEPYDSSSYILGPLNSSTKTYIEFRSQFMWPGLGSIKVEGTFGGGTVPDDIIYLATYLTVKYLNAQSNTASGVSGPVTSESLEGYSRTYAGSNSDAINVNFFADGITIGILGKYRADEILL